MGSNSRLFYVVKICGAKDPKLSYLCKGSRNECREVISQINQAFKCSSKNIFFSYDMKDFIECMYESVDSMQDENQLSVVRYIIDAADLYPEEWANSSDIIACSDWTKDNNGLSVEEEWLLNHAK